VFKVSDEQMNDFAYFRALRDELDNGGIEAMLFDLQSLDLGDWHPMQIYQTDALIEQKVQSLRGLDAWIESMLQEGLLPGAFNKYANRAFTRDLTAQAKEFDRYTNDNLVPRKLKKLFGAEPFGDGEARGWKLPSLPECRAIWERRFGGKWIWNRDVKSWKHRD
jgi:hypothetical protein